MTTDDKVKAIIETDDEIDLTPFIETAHSLVEKVCKGSGPFAYSEDDLDNIETWLAAHFYTIRDNRVTAEKAGSVGANYSVTTALNLQSSMYGQSAMMLDLNGGLAQVNKKANDGKAPLAGQKGSAISWLGE